MALYTRLTKRQISKLVAPFGLPPPKKIKGILEGTVNTYYQLFYPQKSFFLKIDETADFKRLQNELRIFRLVDSIKNKLSYELPSPLRTKEGKNYVPLGKKRVLLFATLQGRKIPPQKLKKNHLFQIGKALAQIHCATISIPLPSHRFNLSEINRVYKEIGKKIKLKLPLIDPLIGQWIIWLKKNEPRGLPEGLIHADLFSENILFRKNRLKGILDFEAAGHGPFLFDIAVSLHALTHDGRQFDFSKGRSFLKGYNGLRKITKTEKKFLEYYLYQSALRFLLTRLRDFELKEGPIKAKPFKDYREYLRRFSEIPELVKNLPSVLLEKFIQPYKIV